MTTTCGRSPPLSGNPFGVQGEPAHLYQGIGAALPRAAVIAVAGRPAQRLERGVDDRCLLAGQPAAQCIAAPEPCGLMVR